MQNEQQVTVSGTAVTLAESILILFIFRNWGRVKLAVTDAKVMTFTAAKCEHNLPQTSLLVGKVIPSNQKKKIGCG